MLSHQRGCSLVYLIWRYCINAGRFHNPHMISNQTDAHSLRIEGAWNGSSGEAGFLMTYVVNPLCKSSSTPPNILHNIPLYKPYIWCLGNRLRAKDRCRPVADPTTLGFNHVFQIYQLAFLTPGIFPAKAFTRKLYYNQTESAFCLESVPAQQSSAGDALISSPL